MESAQTAATDMIGSRSPEVDTEGVPHFSYNDAAELSGLRGVRGGGNGGQLYGEEPHGQGIVKGAPKELSGSEEPTSPKPGNTTKVAVKASESESEPTQIYVVDLPDHNIRCGLCGVQVGTMSWIARHFAVRHRGVPIMYRCSRCGRTNPSHHSVACHIPKCKGMGVATGGGDHGFRCDHCEACFATGTHISGRSTIRHPRAGWQRREPLPEREPQLSGRQIRVTPGAILRILPLGTGDFGPLSPPPNGSVRDTRKSAGNVD